MSWQACSARSTSDAPGRGCAYQSRWPWRSTWRLWDSSGSTAQHVCETAAPARG
jgi:hypothetical protein